MRPALVIAAAMLAAGAYVLFRDSQDQSDQTEYSEQLENDQPSIDDILTGASESAAEFVDNITGGFLKISAMAKVNPGVLMNRNVQAMLRVIRIAEHRKDDASVYRTIFGGQQFNSFADHPRILVKKSGYTSTAAGAYQALISSWDETKRLMNLTDFSPRSQDLFAVGRLAARGALDDVIAGRFARAIGKINREWASLPGSPYGQPTISMDRANQLFADAGGAMNNIA